MHSLGSREGWEVSRVESLCPMPTVFTCPVLARVKQEVKLPDQGTLTQEVIRLNQRQEQEGSAVKASARH